MITFCPAPSAVYAYPKHQKYVQPNSICQDAPETIWQTTHLQHLLSGVQGHRSFVGHGRKRRFSSGIFQHMSVCGGRSHLAPAATVSSGDFLPNSTLQTLTSGIRACSSSLQLLIVGALFSNCASLQNPPELWRNALVCFASRYFLLDPFSHPAPERQLPGNWRSVHSQPSSAPVMLSSLIREAIRSKFPHSGNLVLFFWTSKATFCEYDGIKYQ